MERRHVPRLRLSAMTRYFRLAASATVFNCTRPFSKSPPTILSMFMNMQKAFAMKPFVPYMLHVTAVCVPSGMKLNSVVLTVAKGLRNSSLMRISSFARLSVRVMQLKTVAEAASRK